MEIVDVMDLMELWAIGGPLSFVLAIVAYMVFTGTKGGRNSVLGRFFNLERLYIDSAFKALYIFCAVGVTVMSLNVIVSSAAYNLLGGFFTALIVFAAGQLAIRLLFEFGMAFIRMAVDVHDIRNAYVGVADPDDADCSFGKKDIDLHAAVASLASNAASKISLLASEGAEHAREFAEARKLSQQEVPAAQTAECQVPLANQVSEHDDEWACSCGSGGNTGKFCGFCGSPRPR